MAAHQLIRYAAMRQALAAAADIEGVTRVRGRAMSWERFGTKRQAREIRLRAERKIGQLLRLWIKRGRPRLTRAARRAIVPRFPYGG
jgi:hypothetical protein